MNQINYVTTEVKKKGHQYGTNFQIQDFHQATLKVFYMLYLYYFRNDHDLFYQFHGAHVYSEVIRCRVGIQQSTFKTYLS